MTSACERAVCGMYQAICNSKLTWVPAMTGSYDDNVLKRMTLR